MNSFGFRLRDEFSIHFPNVLLEQRCLAHAWVALTVRCRPRVEARSMIAASGHCSILPPYAQNVNTLLPVHATVNEWELNSVPRWRRITHVLSLSNFCVQRKGTKRWRKTVEIPNANQPLLTSLYENNPRDSSGSHWAPSAWPITSVQIYHVIWTEHVLIDTSLPRDVPAKTQGKISTRFHTNVLKTRNF